MHINVRDILIESVGYNRAYKLSDERPTLVTLRLTQDVAGEITISRLEVGLLVRGRLSTEVELECHRCLRTFNRPMAVRFEQIYAENPGDDQLPIVEDVIDLAPLLEQELNLNLPIKVLHDPNCQGIENVSEKYTKEDKPLRLEDQARITKGIKRGRT